MWLCPRSSRAASARWPKPGPGTCSTCSASGTRPARSPACCPAAPARPPGLTRRLGPGLLAPAATVAVAVTGLRLSGLGTADAIGFALAIAWALAGLVIARKASVTDARPAAWLIALCALTGAVALTAARLGASGPQHTARVVATVTASLVIAISFHFLLALPDGRLARPGRRIVAGLGYATAAGTGIGLAVTGHAFPVMAGALIWP